MMRPLATTALTTSLITALTLLAAGAEELHWPGLLGPQRNGWVDHFKLPTMWPKGLRQLWKVEVGTGYGSPLVSGNRVYQHARQGEDEVVWGLDLKAGKVVWRKSYPVPFKMGGGGERHGKGPKSCPVLSDGRLFTLSITGVLSAWEATSGDLLWRQDYRSKFQQNQPNWGVATSPLVDGERLIVHLGNDKEGALLAFNVKTGKEIWSQGKDGASYSSPLLVEIQGVRQIVQWNHEALVGVESESGRLLWKHPAPHVGHNQNMPTPVFHQGRILLGGEQRGIQSLEPHMEDGDWTVKKIWHQREVALDMSTAVINGELLYGFSHFKSGQLFCLDPKSGQVLWQSPGRTGQNVAFLALPGHVVALVNDGQLRIIPAVRERYEQVASYQVAERETWAPPVFLKNELLVKDLKTLTLWSLQGAKAGAATAR